MSAPLDLAAVKARAYEDLRWFGTVGRGPIIYERLALIAEVERLAAENARLRAVRDVAAEYVTMTVEYDGSDAWAACNDKLKAALRAAGGA